jgi:hypothetical protein
MFEAFLLLFDLDSIGFGVLIAISYSLLLLFELILGIDLLDEPRPRFELVLSSYLILKIFGCSSLLSFDG